MKLIATAILAGGLALPAAAEQLQSFDVAEDLSRFVMTGDHAHEDGSPAYGTPFITQGYIYPAGTLDGGVEGTLEDGSPAFPDLVIGVWTCDGYLVGDGMKTVTGDIVITRQIYQFEGGDVLISQGSELADLDIPVTRAITGGTGDYADAGPALTQVLLGMSDGYGVRLQIDLGTESRHASLAVPATVVPVAYRTDLHEIDAD